MPVLTLDGHDKWLDMPDPPETPGQVIDETLDILEALEDKLSEIESLWKEHDDDAVAHAVNQVRAAVLHLWKVVDG